MATTQKVVRNLLSIRQDGISWASGVNTITFPESFADTLYTRLVTAPGRIVTYVGSKLQTGFQISLDGTTTEGFYEVEGESLAYRDAAVVGADLVQRIHIPLVAGQNTITFAERFYDDKWVSAWPGFDANIILVDGSKSATGCILDSPVDLPTFHMIATGRAA